jgi:hypothetical protein
MTIRRERLSRRTGRVVEERQKQVKSPASLPLSFLLFPLLFTSFLPASTIAQPRPIRLQNVEAAVGTRTQSLFGRNAIGLTLTGGSSYVADKLGLWDGGLALTTHREFGGRVRMQNTTGVLNDHTTHMAGTLVAQGVSSTARGMASGARLQVWDYTNDLSELTAAAPNLLLSVHAYGPLSGWVLNQTRPGTDPNRQWEWWGNNTVSSTEDYLFGFYNANARTIDRITYLNPNYLMVRSADNKRTENGPSVGTPYYLNSSDQQSTVARNRNDGYDIIPGEATAKNILTVGAADVTLNADNELVSLGTSAYSGWGPTDDGRIKPDLLGIGTDVFSTVASSTLAYGVSTGTSMAAANVAGSLLLLQELNAQQTGGRFLRGATLRGLAIHTADRLAPANGPDYRQGWGLLNAEAAATVIRNPNQAHLITEQTLRQGQSWTASIVAQGTDPLIVTLCWTDPEATVTAITTAALNRRTPKLVNDLDLRLTAAGNQMWLPFALNPDRPADVATRADNSRDNVEVIYLPNPVAGQTYSIRVSHKNSLQYGSQAFSILVSGRKRSACSLPSRPLLTASDTTICTGAALQLKTDDLPGLRYEWLRDDRQIAQATTPTCEVSATGSYSVRYTDRSGCVGVSRAVRVSVVTPAVQLSPAEVAFLCPEQAPAQLVAAVEAGKSSTLNWLRNGQLISGATSQTLTPQLPGSYRVQLTQNGCRTFSPEVVVRASSLSTVAIQPGGADIQLPSGASVRLQGPSGEQFRYSWYKGKQVIQNATNPQLIVVEPGTYRLRVAQQQCVAWSDEKTVRWSSWSSVGTLPDTLISFENADSALMAFPNPASQTLYVRYVRPGATQTMLEVIDLLGNQVRSPQPMNLRQGLFWLDLPLYDLVRGQYFLRLTDGYRQRALRFLRQ